MRSTIRSRAALISRPTPSRSEDDDRADAAIRSPGSLLDDVSDLGTRHPSQLLGVDQHRVAMVAAVAEDPFVVQHARIDDLRRRQHRAEGRDRAELELWKLRAELLLCRESKLLALAQEPPHLAQVEAVRCLDDEQAIARVVAHQDALGGVLGVDSGCSGLLRRGEPDLVVEDLIVEPLLVQVRDRLLDLPAALLRSHLPSFARRSSAKA